MNFTIVGLDWDCLQAKSAIGYSLELGLRTAVVLASHVAITVENVGVVLTPVDPSAEPTALDQLEADEAAEQEQQQGSKVYAEVVIWPPNYLSTRVVVASLQNSQKLQKVLTIAVRTVPHIKKCCEDCKGRGCRMAPQNGPRVANVTPAAVSPFSPSPAPCKKPTFGHEDDSQDAGALAAERAREQQQLAHSMQRSEVTDNLFGANGLGKAIIVMSAVLMLMMVLSLASQLTLRRLKKKARDKRRQRLQDATEHPPAQGDQVWLYDSLIEPGASPMLSEPELPDDSEGDVMGFDSLPEGRGQSALRVGAGTGYHQVDEDEFQTDCRELNVTVGPSLQGSASRGRGLEWGMQRLRSMASTTSAL